MKDKYDVPEEVAQIIDKYYAANQLRNIYVKLPFGFKKAKKCAFEANKYFRQFWHKIRELYPELPEEGLSYHRNEMEIRKIYANREGEGHGLPKSS